VFVVACGLHFLGNVHVEARSKPNVVRDIMR
jgi:hypothetical protein